MSSLKLGVNVDHVATLRQARRSSYPCPVHAALAAEQAGADGITLHLREDRRHIHDNDVERMRTLLQTRMNLEMALTAEMVEIAMVVSPEHCCLVPEKREEVTTEGGLDLSHTKCRTMEPMIRQLITHGIQVSLFIDPTTAAIDAASFLGVTTVELNTGGYAEGRDNVAVIQEAAKCAHAKGLIVNAGHGLTQHNVGPIAAITEIRELNIGHAIISDALFIGLPAAVVRMKETMASARRT